MLEGMNDSPFKQGLPWFIAGLLLIVVSAALYLYDYDQSDQEILAQIENTLQEDFEACIKSYSDSSALVKDAFSDCAACELTYGSNDRLSFWTENRFLPTQRYINRLRALPIEQDLLTFENKTYFQVRKNLGDSTIVSLIPIYIRYEVNNEFLNPYIYLGRWQNKFSGSGNQKYIKNIQVGLGEPEAEAEIKLLHPTTGRTLIYMNNVSVVPFRANIRYAVLIFLLLGIITLSVFLRIYALKKWHLRYFINVSLFAGVIFIRLLLYWVGLPGTYIDVDLFSPNILAFHELAPSLGELTLNVVTFIILVWLVYTQFFRTTLPLIRKITQSHWIAWPVMLLTIFLSSFLMFLYIGVFEAITSNSQVDIEFSNFFKTNIYSFLILLDVGILLLGIMLMIFLLLKPNVIYLNRYKKQPLFVVVQVLALMGFNLWLFELSLPVVLLVTIGLLMLGFALYRLPFKPLLRHDLANYLIIVLMFSILVTYNIVMGINLGNQLKAQQIAERILGSQVAKTVFAFSKSIQVMNGVQEQIKIQEQTFQDINLLRDWLTRTHLDPNFKEFDVQLFVYSSDGKRLDKTEGRETYFGPDSDIPLESRGEKIDDNLYQLPNSANKDLDLYVGKFELELTGDTAGKTMFIMELSPSRRETEGLYPSLLLDEEVYNDIKLINSFDHAIYRDGLLYSESGKGSFPIVLPNHESYRGEMIPTLNDKLEFIKSIGNSKVVVVRYTHQDFLDVITSFSFIFYFFAIASILLIGIPVLLFRSLRARRFTRTIPLRSKIRLGLLAISILPMLVIIILLYPFVANRYDKEAREELSAEATRIANLIGNNYLNLQNDPFSRLTLLREFKESITNLETVVENDINIFDEEGKRITSTQPLIFEVGISSDLMNSEALKILREGKTSDLVITERVGDLEYLSGYRPIVGNTERPIGYVNIPYLSKQDQLNDQVIDFLAYLANIYLLVFLMINLLAVLVSGTITKPLSMIQQRLSTTSLENINEPIDYESKDEIGAIVSAYNQMVNQLTESEKKLTQNQRELAWRQMARQVAHEIKNPLTPMKLSIQHLKRAWGEKTPRLEKMFPKVMNTLLVQIDSMVNIANSFSEFAKMPEPDKSLVQVNEVLLEVVDLYTQSEEAIWLIDIPQEKFWIYADRDQLSRCFNNIIKNGLQAIEDNGILHISMRILGDRVRVEIKDNGQGMSEEVQNRVFEPSFSTKTSGMGLGLAIVKRIIEHSGGDITFESIQGEGTTFFIELPAAEQELLI